MGTSLLQVLRTVATDADARSAFEADPSGYLGQYGYGDVPVDDLAEAVELTADTLPPETAMEITPSEGDPGLIGAVRQHDGEDGPSLDDDPSAELAFGDADFDGGPDAASDPELAASDPELSASDPELSADDPEVSGDDDTDATEAFGADAGSEADAGVDEVDFGSGSLGDGPDFGEPTGGATYEEPGFGEDAGFGENEADVLSEPVEGTTALPTDDPSFDEAENFASQLDDEPVDDPQVDIDDIGSF